MKSNNKSLTLLLHEVHKLTSGISTERKCDGDNEGLITADL